MWFSEVLPSVLGQYQFNWWDLNENGQPDSPGTDNYEYRWSLGDFKLPDIEYLSQMVDRSLHAPIHNEITAGVEHQLFKDLAVKLTYLHKKKTDLFGWAKYDLESGRYWYKLDQAPDWYVPFTTIVPAYGSFPEQQVTVYFMSENSPYESMVYIKTNIPEQFVKYNGLELAFDKRFSHGWSLGGSVTISKTTSQSCGDSPNDFVNTPGRDSYDVPFMLNSTEPSTCPTVSSLPFHELPAGLSLGPQPGNRSARRLGLSQQRRALVSLGNAGTEWHQKRTGFHQP